MNASSSAYCNFVIQTSLLRRKLQPISYPKMWMLYIPYHPCFAYRRITMPRQVCDAHYLLVDLEWQRPAGDGDGRDSCETV